MKKRFNKDYKIIMSIELPNYEFVLGENLDACCSQYVTKKRGDKLPFTF